MDRCCRVQAAQRGVVVSAPQPRHGRFTQSGGAVRRGAMHLRPSAGCSEGGQPERSASRAFRLLQWGRCGQAMRTSGRGRPTTDRCACDRGRTSIHHARTRHHAPLAPLSLSEDEPSWAHPLGYTLDSVSSAYRSRPDHARLRIRGRGRWQCALATCSCRRSTGCVGGSRSGLSGHGS